MIIFNTECKKNEYTNLYEIKLNVKLVENSILKDGENFTIFINIDTLNNLYIHSDNDNNHHHNKIDTDNFLQILKEKILNKNSTLGEFSFFRYLLDSHDIKSYTVVTPPEINCNININIRLKQKEQKGQTTTLSENKATYNVIPPLNNNIVNTSVWV